MTECIVSFAPACVGAGFGCISGAFIATDCRNDRLCKRLQALGVGLLSAAGLCSRLATVFHGNDEQVSAIYDFLHLGVPIVAAATIPAGVAFFVLNALKFGRRGGGNDAPPHPLLASGDTCPRTDDEVL